MIGGPAPIAYAVKGRLWSFSVFFSWEKCCETLIVQSDADSIKRTHTVALTRAQHAAHDQHPLAAAY